jgi:hypothetical protein
MAEETKAGQDSPIFKDLSDLAQTDGYCDFGGVRYPGGQVICNPTSKTPMQCMGALHSWMYLAGTCIPDEETK